MPSRRWRAAHDWRRARTAAARGEIRAVASDSFWLSPFYERDSITFHFTWKRTPAVAAAVARVEAVLAPWQPRPHWAKLFTYNDEFLDAAFPRRDSFEQLRRRYDPDAATAATLRLTGMSPDHVESGLAEDRHSKMLNDLDGITVRISDPRDQ